MEKNYIVLYQDEMSWDAWKDYCNATGASRDSQWIKIYFDGKDVETNEGEN